LAISETTLRAWQQAHRLPFLKIGGTVRFVPEEIRHWAAEQAVDARVGPFSCRT
jgi:excisionase family DNA binding protein